MTLIVEDGTGLTNSNGYISLAGFKAYHLDRENSLGTYTDPQISSAIVRASDYMDRRFGPRFVGYVSTVLQAMQWPRKEAFYRDNRPALLVPVTISLACAEYGLRALAANLSPDPTYDSSNALIKESDQHVGPIVDHVVFGYNGVKVNFHAYPIADALINQLTVPQGQLARV